MLSKIKPVSFTIYKSVITFVTLTSLHYKAHWDRRGTVDRIIVIKNSYHVKSIRKIQSKYEEIMRSDNQ